PGFDDCNKDPSDGCETGLASDIKNCGACNKACMTPNANALCVLGQCSIASCLQAFRDCDGMPGNGCEVNTQTDPKNCSACGSACAPLPNAVAACMSGACVVGSCSAGFGNCDMMVANGCETDLSSSPANCGACGIACVMRPNLITNCQMARCVDVGCTP